MKLRLLAVSHRQPAWVEDGCRDYERRLPREWGFELVVVKPEPRTSGQSAARVQAAEAARLRAAAPKGALLVALDERGEPWSTRQLADRLASWQREGRTVAFLIGGADGLDPALQAECRHRLSLSALTLPHGLVRIVVAEQLYRAASLLAGHPYHR